VHCLGTKCKSTPLQLAALSGNIKLVQLLLKYQVNIDMKNATGKTALHFAAVGGHVSVIQALVSSGANCTIKDDQGRTAQEYADQKGQAQAASVLMRVKDPDMKDEDEVRHDSHQVHLTFEKLDPAAVNEKREADRRYEECRRRLSDKQRRPPRSGDVNHDGCGDGGMWVPIGNNDAIFQGRMPRNNKVKPALPKQPTNRAQVASPDDVAGKVKGGPGNMEFLEKELKAIVGMDNVKKMLRSLCKKVSVDQQRHKFGFRMENTLNMIFLGAPGTGKTSMARVVAKLMKHFGILEKGHLVEVCRKDLVAEYCGQSAVKTAAKVQEALDGVLFIDEAYALKHEGSKDAFGQVS
jgi:hypothetical protein